MNKLIKSWDIRIADNLDYDTAFRIGTFISSFSTSSSVRRTYAPEYYLWKIMDNPAGRGFVSLAVDKERIVGTTTVTRKRVFFQGCLIEAAEIGDTFTESAYQKQGIFTSLVTATRDRATDSGVRLIYGTPNDQSLIGYEKNCQFFSQNGLDLFLWVLPLKPANAAGLWKPKFKVPSIQKAVDKAYALGLRALASLAPGRGCETDLHFDVSFDVLNETLKMRYTWMLSRGRDDLEFRIINNPERDRYGLIVDRNQNGRLEAALIFKDCRQDNLRVMFVADLFGARRLPVAGLWKQAVLLGLRQNFDLLAVWAPRSWATFFPLLPLSPVPVTHKEVIFYANDLGLEALKDQGQWLFSMLDTDNI